MSRLDDHVSAVQNRLAMRKFIVTLAWMSLVFAGVVWIAVLVDRIFQVHLPKPMAWLYGGIGAVVASALAYAIYRRPTAREAAVPIDQKLGLKEKISTALFIRPSNDPFAQAAVKDAEQTAQQVVLKLNEHFPLTFPRPAIATCAVALAAVLSFHYIDPMNFFDRKEKAQQAQVDQQKSESAKKKLELALATVSAMPPDLANNEAIQLAKAELTAMLKEPVKDAEKASRTAVRALQDVQDAIKDQLKNSSKYAQAQNESKMFRNMQKPVEGQGPVADAHRAISDSKFTEAIQDLEKAVENFDKMDKADQQKAAQQMQNLANQLQQMANNPDQQKKQEQQLQQQMGMNKDQAQQAQQLMKQAAQGDKQAQQQLQQMAQQAMQQAGMNQQQQQQMQQQMQQMQAQANAMNQAQQMQQAAQAMAQAMQQAQQAGQQGAQQPGQQGQGNPQMAQAMQQMQQQMQQMQASQQDAQQIAAAQQAAQQAAGECQGGMAGNQPGGKPGNANGGWGNKIQGDPAQQQNQGGNGFAGPNQGGMAAGDRNYKAEAPFGVKQEIDPTQDDEKGRILASTYIKDSNPLKGQSTETLKQVAERAQAEQTDEIDQERIGRQQQNTVKEYFSSMSKDAPEQK